MNATMNPGMFEALELTRAGRLSEATAAIQRALGGDASAFAARPEAAPAAAPHRPPPHGGPKLELLPGGKYAEQNEPAAEGRAESSGEATFARDTARDFGGGGLSGFDLEGTLNDALSNLGGNHAFAGLNGATLPGLDGSELRVGGLKDKLKGLLDRFRGGEAEPAVNRRRPEPRPEPPVGRKPRPEEPREGDGSLWLQRAVDGPEGQRDYRLFVPSSYDGRTPMPLVLMLHGCTQDPDDFAAGTRMNAHAEKAGVLVAYPRQPSGANPNKCWNWFEAAQQRKDGAEPALFRKIVQDVARDHAVDRSRIYAAGLSAGGAATAVLACTHGDLFAAVCVHSGLACGSARGMAGAFQAMRKGAAGRAPERQRMVPTVVFHGTQDGTVNPINADHVVAQARSGTSGWKTEVERGEAGGRNFERLAYLSEDGTPVFERWLIKGQGHAWSGGDPSGSYADATGPDASARALEFFMKHTHPDPAPLV